MEKIDTPRSRSFGFEDDETMNTGFYCVCDADKSERRFPQRDTKETKDRVILERIIVRSYLCFRT